MTRDETRQAGMRLVLVLLGSLAGLAGWAFVDWLPDRIGEPRLLLFASGFATAFFTILLALTGPARVGPAALVSAPVALVLAGLLYGASARHVTVAGFLDQVYPALAFGMALLIATPFLAAWLRDRTGWRDYPSLFALSWRIVVRYAAAVLFTALFWGLLSLSDALLHIVGVPLMAWVTDRPALAAALTGAVFGFALAIAHELRDFVSPRLVLRLLQMLLPPVLAVAAVFLALLPMRGFSGLELAGFSPAATLMGFALAAVVLITVAVNRDRREAVQGRLLVVSAQILALLAPVLAGLALWALWIRVAGYGLSPERLMAGTIGAVLLAYGAAYALAVVLRRGWMARIRAANTWIALVSVAVCLVWLSPLFVPERIAAQDQLARAQRGVPAEILPLRELAWDWGHPGRAALAELEALRPDLAARIALAREADPGRIADAAPDDRAALRDAVPVYPAGAVLPDTAWDGLTPFLAADLRRACANVIPEGPGCAVYVGRFTPGAGADEALLFQRFGPDYVQVQSLSLEDGRLALRGFAGGFGVAVDGGLPDAALAALHRGEARLAPSDAQVLRLGDMAIFPRN
ncbi:DUF4153 domain-containing protein [Thalassococcus sp. CAU 1522]|uniref:DUF4153 domain-containing protein n=1 Tax=Thalassococcus arenae TaxID=2851652 RepID=A0ABS6N378_9RHOB|nr:DUF4153 domain-containing protein [Thalassococcus arenae]MBV2358480.1 DUF4153 domain-containing protein [Thalassococcus arenae]